MVLVELNVTDYGRTMNAQVAAERMAKFLCHSATDGLRYVRLFCSILRNSFCWNMTNYHDNLEKYFNRLRVRRVKNYHDDEFICLVNSLFKTCRKDDDINTLRGLMTECLMLQACKEKQPKRWSLHKGCTVRINGVLICASTNGESKKTVDIGAWYAINSSGFFIEVKVHPYSFHTKDALYLSALRQELQKYNEIKYKICIFSLDVHNLMERQAEQEGYPIERDTFIINENNLFSIDIFNLLG